MPNIVPAPITPATQTKAGTVSTTSQTMGGDKTFIAANGTSSTDIAFKIGTSIAEASVVTGATLLKLVSGIGGTERVFAKFAKPSSFTGILTIDQNFASNTGAIQIINAGTGDTGIFFESAFSSGGTTFGISSSEFVLNTTNRGLHFNATNDAYVGGGTPALIRFDGSTSYTTKDLFRITATSTGFPNLFTIYDSSLVKQFGVDPTGSVFMNGRLTLNDGIYVSGGLTSNPSSAKSTFGSFAVSTTNAGALWLEAGATPTTTNYTISASGSAASPILAGLTLNTPTSAPRINLVSSGTSWFGQIAYSAGQMVISDTSGSAFINIGGTTKVGTTNENALFSTSSTTLVSTGLTTQQSSLGAGASDILLKTGSTVADGSVNATARLFTVRTGITGVETEKLIVYKSNVEVPVQFKVTKPAVVNEFSLIIPTSAGGTSGISFEAGNTSGAWMASDGTQLLLSNYNHPITIQPAYKPVIINSYLPAAGATDVGVNMGITTLDANITAGALLAKFTTGSGDKAWITKGGGLILTGTPYPQNTSLTDGVGVALGSYNVNIGSSALWLGGGSGIVPSTSNFTLAYSTSGGLGTPVGTTLNSSNYITIQGGAGSIISDVVTKLGTTLADASVSNSAKLLSIQTGIGGTPVEQIYVKRGGVIGGGTTQTITMNDSIGITLAYNNASFVIVNSNGLFAEANLFNNLTSLGADGASAVSAIIDTSTTWSNATAKLLSIRNHGTEQLSVATDGTIGHPSTLNLSAAGTGGVVLKAQGSSICTFTAGGGVSPQLDVTYAIYMGAGSNKGIQWGNAPMRLTSEAPDSASALGLLVNNIYAWTTAGAKLASFKNSGVEKLYIDKDGLISVAGITMPAGGTVNFATSVPTTSGYWTSTSAGVAFYASNGGRFDASGTATLASETLGAGSTDVVTKLGTTTADISVNASAELLRITTGIGGSEVPSFKFWKSGVMTGQYGSLTMNSTSGTRLGGGAAIFGASAYLGNQATIESSLGSVGTDVCIKAGSSLADASVNGNAKLLSIGSGIGGTYTEYASFLKGANGGFYIKSGASLGSISIDNTSGTILNWNGVSAVTLDSVQAYLTGPAARVRGTVADSLTAVATVLESFNTLSTAGAKLVSVRNNGVEKLFIDKDGVIGGGTTQTITMNNSVGVSLNYNNSSLAYVDNIGLRALSAQYSIFTSYATTSGTAVSTIIDTATNWTTAGDKLLSIRNHGVEKAWVDKDGNASFASISGTNGAFLSFGSIATYDGDVTEYLLPGFSSTTSTDEIGYIMPVSGIVSNLYIKATTGPTSDVLVFTVRKNGVATTMTVTLAVGATSANDTTHSFSVVAGDEVTLECNPGPAITVGAKKVRASVRVA